MDKELDYRRYDGIAINLLYSGDNFLNQRKILSTRIIRLSAAESKYSFSEIGRVSLESGHYQKSFAQLKRALIIDPDNSYIQVSLAEVLLKLEKENEAFPILKKVLCRDPTYSHPHRVLIRRLKEQERLGDLESIYQEIANTFPDTQSVEKLYYECAQALTNLKEHSRALEMYKTVYKANPNAGYNYEYAFACYHEGEFEEARVQFAKLWQWNPTHGVFANNVAFTTYCMGRLQEAFGEMEELIANGLMSYVTYSNLILVLYHMDKDEEVMNKYRDLLQQNLGANGPTLRSMYEEALRITRVILERENIDEETREFNTKKIEAINLVLSLIN